ncbi:flippase [Actinoplanes sp. CA-142083]|uniref:flippase n=1 Tax=Actinoplanes sp. CA-142083 TaxID=3239903 RepID=UPI003D8BBDD0
MSQTRRILKNATALYVAEFVSRAMTLVLTILVARTLGSTEYGKLALVLSVMAIAQNLTDFGFSTLGVKLIANEPGAVNRIGSAMLVLKVALGVVTSGAIIVIVLLAGVPGDLAWIFVFNSLTLVTLAYTTSMSSIYRGHEIMQFDAYGRTGIAFLTTAVGALLISSGHGVVAISALTLALTFVNALYMKSVNDRQRLFRFEWPRSTQEYGPLLKQALPFAVLAVLVAVSFRVDALILGLFESTTAVGEYSAAYRVFELLLIVPAIFAGVLLPTTSARLNSDKASAHSLTMIAIRYFTYLCFPLAIGVALLAGPLITLVYGNEYPGSIIVLQIMSFTVIPTFISSLTANIIHASSRPQHNTYIALFNVIFNVSLNLILVPILGLRGAAITSLATQTIGLVIGTVLIARHVFVLPYWLAIWRPILASLVMAGVIVAFTSLWLLPVYIIVYAVTLYALRAFSKRDQEILREALPARRRGTVST